MVGEDDEAAQGSQGQVLKGLVGSLGLTPRQPEASKGS